MVQLDLLDTLPERMEEHAKLFDGLLQLIPARHYITEKPEVEEGKNPYMQNKRKNAPKQAIKEATKKAKKAKLDPENDTSVAAKQKELKEKLEAEKEQEVEDDEEVEEESDDDDDDDEVQGAAMNGGDFQGLDNKKLEETAKPMVRSDIEDLHKRLQQRIADMRTKRDPHAGTSKARSREEILAERHRKREEKKKALKAKKEKGKQAAAEEIVMAKPTQKAATDARSAEAIKMDGDVFFGKLNAGEQKKKKGPTDLKTQLKMAEAKKEKLEKLKAEDAEAHKKAQEEEDWKKALSLASGEKIKDDPKLLKKSLKRTEHQKKKSAQEWAARKEKVKKDEQAKIKKREENIKNRKEKGNKKKKARHGFEGAAFGYGGKVSKNNKNSNSKGKNAGNKNKK